MKTKLWALWCFPFFLSFYSHGQIQIGQDIIGEASGNNSGWSLSLNDTGTRVAIGAFFAFNDNQDQSGHVRVFERNANGPWQQIGQDIDGDVDQERFGNSCSLNNQGDVLVVGAPRNTGNGTNAGHVKVYSLVSNGQWIQIGQDIEAEAAFDQFGFAVDINASGNTIVIGAPTNDAGGNTNNNRGHVRVYSLNTSNQWMQIGSDIDGLVDGDRLGTDVSINDSGDRIVIGIPENDDNGSNAGQVKVYQLVSGNWTQLGQNISGLSGSLFGSSVDFNDSGDTVIIGAPASNAGSAFIYELVGSQWTQVGQTIEGDSSGDDLGTSVCINNDGSIISVGAPSSTGYVRTFEILGVNLSQLGPDILGSANSFTGFSVDLNGDGSQIAVGSPVENNSQGTVRIYQFNEPPVIANCPTNIMQNNDSGSCSAVVNWTLPTASDSDGTVVSFTSTHNPGDTFAVGTTTVTYTATDDAGATTNCSFDIVVNDTEQPSVVTQNVTVFLDVNGQASIVPSGIENGSTDNCAIASSSLDITSFDCSNLGANTVILTVTDVNGNINTATGTVTVEDNIAPTPLAQDITVQLNPAGNVSITAQDIDNGSTDNCSVSLSLDTTDFTCSDLGQNTVILTVSDPSGNTDTATAVVTVEEDPNQSLTAVAQDITVQLDGNGNATITPQDINDGSGSGCNSNPTLSLDITSFDCSNLGTNTVTLTATDGVTTVTDTAIVTVEDNVLPTVLTQDITIQLDANGQASILASDIDNGSSDNCGNVSLSASQTIFTCANLGVNEIVLTVTDGSGNSNFASMALTVEDTIAPTAIAQDITIQLNPAGNVTIAPQDINNGSTDNCSVNLSLNVTDLTCSNLGQNTLTLTVTDPSGNTDTATAVVTVEEDPNQQLTAIAQDITVQLDANGNVTITPQDVDNGSGSGCNSTPTLSLDITSFDCNDIGQNTVALTVTDGTDTATDLAVVTIEDILPPTIVTQDVTAVLDASGNASITVQEIDNGSTDNCSIATSSLDISSFDCTDVGTNTVTLTVTDVNGNTATGTATVNVQDTVAPVATAQNITVQLDASGNISITPQQINNGSSDNCAVDTIVLDVTDFTCSDLGQNTVTLTVTDTGGNTDSVTAVVTVEENPNQQLTAIAQDITVQLDANGNATITPQDVDNGSGSGCNSNPTLSLDITSFDCSNIGTNTVTLTATEGTITSMATAIVTVEDTLGPNIVLQDITVNLDANNTAPITVSDLNNGTTDNCTVASGLTLVLDTTTFDCSDLGSNTVNFTATDGNGNTSTATATVTVLDVTAPTVVTQDLTITLDSEGNASVSPEQIDNGSTDDCSGVASLTLDATDFTCPSLGDVTVTLTVTDASGNSATGTARVTITATDEDNNGVADACENQELVIPKGFSPNNDNINDTWVIENIEDYPNAKVSVFNRWGEKVFEEMDYQNDWDAVSNQTGTDKRLPSGSYLYVIEPNNPEVPPVQGWLYINY